MNPNNHNLESEQRLRILCVVVAALLTMLSASSVSAQVISVADALDNHLSWSISNYDVVQVMTQTTNSHDGVDAVVLAMQTNYLGWPLRNVHTTVIGPGTVSFWYQTCDHDGPDARRSVIDYGDHWSSSPGSYVEVHTALFAGGTWSNAIFSVGAGVHDLYWGVVYEMLAPGQNLFLDQVSYLPDPGADATPLIFSQPQPQAAVLRSTITFQVQVTSNSRLSFQWRQNDTNIADCGRITGTTNDTLTITDVQMSDLGNYSVAVTNAVGWTNSTEAALLLINPGDGSLGFRSNQFGFNIYGPSGTVAVIEGSTNLLNWLTLSTTVLGPTPFYFNDPGSTGRPSRWYRVR